MEDAGGQGRLETALGILDDDALRRPATGEPHRRDIRVGSRLDPFHVITRHDELEVPPQSRALVNQIEVIAARAPHDAD